MRYQNSELTTEDRLFIQRYINAVARKLEEDYRLDSKETTYLLEGSVFMALIEEDPEFVVNYHPTYWAKEIYASKQRVYQT